MFVTQLCSNAGISVWWIVWLTINCCFMSDRLYHEHVVCSTQLETAGSVTSIWLKQQCDRPKLSICCLSPTNALNSQQSTSERQIFGRWICGTKLHNGHYPVSCAVLGERQHGDDEAILSGSSEVNDRRGAQSVFNQSRDVRTKRCFGKVINWS